VREQRVASGAARRRRPSRRQREAAARARAVAEAERVADETFARYQAAERDLMALLRDAAPEPRVRAAKSRTAGLARAVVAARGAVRDAKAPAAAAPVQVVVSVSESLGAELEVLGSQIRSSDRRSG
jgi:hypothetical protein